MLGLRTPVLIQSLCARYHADGHAIRVECSNAGFPLTFAHWPQGSLDAFPAALTFRSWKAEPPCTVPAPFFTDDMNVSTELLGNYLLYFRMDGVRRLTTLLCSSSTLSTGLSACNLFIVGL